MADTIVIRDFNSVDHVLTDGSAEFTILRGPSGRFAAPVQLTTNPLSSYDGDVLQNVVVRGHPISMPISFQAATEAALRTAIRGAMTWLNPKQGQAQLRVTDVSSVTRYKNVIYSAGLELDENNGLLTWQNTMLVLQSLDAYWRATSLISNSYNVPGTNASFFPFFPLLLGGSDVFAKDSVSNPGDVTAWPTWTITGPGTDPSIVNADTGEAISLVGYSLGIGEQITIATEPGQRSVTKQDGTDLYASLTSRQFWGLNSGSTGIQLEMNAASQALGSMISYSFEPWYFTP